MTSNLKASSGIDSRSNSLLQPVNDPRDEEPYGIVSTKTITHLDQFGNTQSVTTEIVRELPDGSNIIEKTTSYSKPTSRCNSRIAALSNSLDQEKYNMSRIDEELNDFAYSYLDSTHTSSPAFEYGRRNTSGRSQSLGSTSDHCYRPDASRTNSVDTSGRNLKSILKKTPSVEGLCVHDTKYGSPGSSPASLDSERFTEDRGNLLQSPVALAHSAPEQNSQSVTPKSFSTKIKFASDQLPQKDSRTCSTLSRANEDLSSQPRPVLPTKQRPEDGLSSSYSYHNHHRNFRAYSLRSPSLRESSQGKKNASNSSSVGQQKPKVQAKDGSSDLSNSNFIKSSPKLLTDEKSEDLDRSIQTKRLPVSTLVTNAVEKMSSSNGASNQNKLTSNSSQINAHGSKPLYKHENTSKHLDGKLDLLTEASVLPLEEKFLSVESSTTPDDEQEQPNILNQSRALRDATAVEGAVKVGKFKLFIKKYMLSQQ